MIRIDDDDDDDFIKVCKLMSSNVVVLFKKILFIWLFWILVVACGIFDLCCSMRDLELQRVNPFAACGI